MQYVYCVVNMTTTTNMKTTKTDLSIRLTFPKSWSQSTQFMVLSKLIHWALSDEAAVQSVNTDGAVMMVHLVLDPSDVAGFRADVQARLAQSGEVRCDF